MLGPLWGGVVFLLDVAKGFVAALTPLVAAPAGTIASGGLGLGPALLPSAIAAGLAAILGHMFSPFAGFKGGRGVATSLGVFLGVAGVPTLVALGLWALLFALSRRVSVGSIGAAAAYPFLLLWLAPAGTFRPWIVGVGALVALLVLLRHVPNMRRLLRGTEPPLIGKGSKPAEGTNP